MANTVAAGNTGDVLTTTQAAFLADLSERTLARRLRDGSLPSRKIGRRRVVRRADLDAFLERGGRAS